MSGDQEPLPPMNVSLKTPTDTSFTGDVDRNEDRGIEVDAVSESGPLSDLNSPLIDRGVPAETLDVVKTMAPGLRLGRYRLVSVLGRGGMGEVWLAEDPQLKRLIAVKILRPDRTHSPEMISGFLEEGRRLAKIGSDSIIRVYDCGSDGGICYLVSEYHEEGSLKDYVKRNPPTFEQIVDWMIAISEAAHYAHHHGIVHRDIKPANILMRVDGRPLLADFGLAISEEEQAQASSGTFGTCYYMSPEQLRGEANLVDGRSDVYAIGIVLYELLTKRLPFKAKSFTEYRELVLRREPWPPRSVVESIPQELEAIVLKCLAKNPSDRYSTAADLAGALREYRRRASGETQRLPLIQQAALFTAIVALILAGYSIASNVIRTSDDEPLNNQPTFLVSQNDEPASVPQTSPVSEKETPIDTSVERIEKTSPNNQSGGDVTKVSSDTEKTSSLDDPEKKENVLRVSEVPVYQVPMAVWQILDDGEAIRISSDTQTLIELGKYEGGNLEFSVYVERPTVEVTLGIFWGYGSSKEQRLSKRYETWRLAHTTEAKKSIGYTFATHPITAPRLGGSKGIGGLWLPRTYFADIKPRKIGFELRDGKLHRLIWDDYITYDAYKDREKLHPEPDTCFGSFGLIGASTSSLYSRPSVNGRPVKFVE